jgi:hypothetical protein
MNEETFNLTLRKFLKKVGVTSQREIEKAVWDRLDAGGLRGDERLPVSATVRLPDLDVTVVIDGEIALNGATRPGEPSSA